MVNIAILGFGTVGSGVYEVVKNNADVIKHKAGDDINIKYVLDLRDFPNHPVSSVLTHNFDDIINDDSVKVVIEVMGGVDVPYKFVKSALEKGKHVVTSNKALVAAKGTELLSIARDKNINFFFEASVGGGIPIIRPLMSSLTSDKILEVMGILNGTTNYILTEMTEKGSKYEDVLKEAQKLGYAEADPTADVEGYDACRKIAILSSLAYGKTVDYEDIPTEGISSITTDDISYAKALKGNIKLLGSSQLAEHGIAAMVAPFIVPNKHPLSCVNGAFNAIFIKGSMLGDTMYYGSGAGSYPTACAVVSDVIEAIKHMNINILVDWSSEKNNVLSISDVPVNALIRVKTDDIENTKKEVSEMFDDIKFIDVIKGEFGIVVNDSIEGHIKEKMKQIENISSVSFAKMIRMI